MTLNDFPALKPAALALFIAGTAAAPAIEPLPVVKNAGFEDGKGEQIPSWGWWSRTGSGSAVRTDKTANKGKFSACIRHDGERDWAFTSERRILAQPGEAYRIMAAVKVEKGHANFAMVALKQGKLLSWDIGSTSTSGKDWHQIEAIAEVPAGCDQVYVRFTGKQDTLLWLDDIRVRSTTIDRTPKPKVEGSADTRVVEQLDRGLIATRLENGDVYLSWRLFPTERPGDAFHVFRQVGDEPGEKLTRTPVETTTDFLDRNPPAGEELRYSILRIGREISPATADATPRPYRTIKLLGDSTFRKIGIADLDGDQAYDFVIKSPDGNVDPYEKYWYKSPDTFKLDAYTSTGGHLWTHDLGWSIERGIWYSPYLVYDFNGDGRAEVALKSGEGDPRDKDGRVQSGPEYLSILDGLTGNTITRIDWPSRDLFASTSRPYNYASRNQLGIAYLDGKTPCLIVGRGTYNTIVVAAYELRGSKLRLLWQWDNRKLPGNYKGQGAHWMHAADVDSDGRDEVIIGSAVIDDNGDPLWTTGLGHPDHSYIGDLDPARPGLEIYYGMESRQKEANGMCMVDAATGKILWGHQGATRHVHGHGMCADIDPDHPGAECYSADTDEKKKFAWSELRSANGRILSKDTNWNFGPLTAYWDADPQREVIWKNKISDYRGDEHPPGKIDGRIVNIADILGDWREEIIVSTKGELRIYSTTIPATDRRPCLMTDPIYRIDVAHAAMGYTQVPMLGYDVASQ